MKTIRRFRSRHCSRQTSQTLRLFILIMMALPVLLTAAPAASDALPVFRIGIVSDEASAEFPGEADRFKSEIDRLTAADYDMRYTELRPDASSGMEWYASAVERMMADPEIDAILAVGVLSSHGLLARQTFSKPSLATVVIDPDIQQVPKKENRSGKHNLTYIHMNRDFAKEIRKLRQVSPFRKAAVIEDREVGRSVSAIRQTLSDSAEALGIELVFIGGGESPEPLFDRIPPDVDAVIVTPFLRLNDEAAARLIAGLTQRRLPGFSLWGKRWVKKGLLAGVCPNASADRIVRRTALDVLQIIQGGDPASLPVDMEISCRLMINMATARALDVPVGWEVRTEAMLIADGPGGENPMGLLDAVQEALKNNLELAAENRQVRSGQENVRQALARLLPRFSLSSSATMIDQDRARASFGLLTERRWAGTASVSQLLYSDAALTGYRLEKDLQDARQAAFEGLQLDIGREAAVGYLDALSASVLVRIRKANLELSRANLLRAENRCRIGMANPSEVYRWRSKIATDKKELLAAEARLDQAKIALNRIMARRTGARLTVREVAPDAPLFINACRDLFERLDTPGRLYAFEQFMAGRAIGQSPEIRQVKAAIAAAEKRMKTAGRIRWLPTVVFQGGYSRYLAESGAGTESVPPQFPVVDISTGQPQATALIVPFPDLSTDDAEWHLGINAVFDLYTGGAIASEYRQAKEEWHRLKLRHRDAADRIRAGVGAVVRSAGASYPGIELSRSAADAAEQNLDLVSDAYERGVVSIVDLLEAQNAATTARQVAATAEHEFLKDMVRLQRAIGRKSYEMPLKEAETFREDLKRYVESMSTASEF